MTDLILSRGFRLVKAEVWDFLKSFQKSKNQSIILIQSLFRLKMSATIQALAVVGKTLNCPEHRESLQKKFRKIRDQNKEVNNIARDGRKNRKQIKKGNGQRESERSKGYLVQYLYFSA